MTNAPKVVGQLCPDCGTPYIQGKNGQGYCKPCYIKWKNGQDNKSTQVGSRDYEAENRGKVRHGLICAFVEGKTAEELKAQMPDFKLLLMPLENLIMGEKKDDAASKPVVTPIPEIQEGEAINVEDIPF